MDGRWLIAYLFCLVGSGCGSDGEPDGQSGADTGTPDGGTDVSAEDASDGTDSDVLPDVSDGSSDAGNDVPDGADAEVPDVVDADTADASPACEGPAPRYSDAPEAQAFVTDASACGQAAFGWVADPADLGAWLESADRAEFPAALLQVVLEGEGVVLPATPEFDVVLETVRYQTQDRGVLTDATTLVAVPSNRPMSAGAPPVLLLLHGTTGFNDSCAPSDDTEWRALAALFASFGYVTVAPDYLGLKALGEPSQELHSYLVGQPTALASIDAVRVAAEAAGRLVPGLCPSSEVVVVGASQGGHAALWVDRLAPWYAPEWTWLGTVATVPPADVLGQVTAGLVEDRSSTLNSAVLLATGASWYGLRDELDSVFLPPWDSRFPALLEEECSTSDELPETRTALFTESLLAAADARTLGELEPWGCLLRENGLVTTPVPRAPDALDSYGILFVTSGADGLVDTSIERASFVSLCESGLPVTYLECAAASHTEGTLWALPEILTFLQARLAREAWVSPASCAAPPALRCEGTPADE